MQVCARYPKYSPACNIVALSLNRSISTIAFTLRKRNLKFLYSLLIVRSWDSEESNICHLLIILSPIRTLYTIETYVNWWKHRDRSGVFPDN